VRSWIEVDTAAIAANARRLAELVAPARLCAVVKSNAYGHGLVPVSRALAATGIEGLRFGVFSMDEALALRQAGIQQTVIVLGPADAADLADAARAHLEVALLDEADAEPFARGGIAVHLKVETGTRRFGIAPRAAKRLLHRARDLDLNVAGLYSHLANAEDLDEAYTARQLGALLEVSRDLRSRDAAGFVRPLHHIAASAAAMMWPHTRLDMVRCGIAIYGAWPSSQVREFMATNDPRFELNPALRWIAPIVQVKEVGAGDSVGYGCTFVPDRDSRIAVLPVGYADGLPRAAGNGSVRTSGGPASLIGRICMNACMADVSGIVPAPQRGDRVELDVDELAAAAGTINYEILARLSPALERRYGQ